MRINTLKKIGVASLVAAACTAVSVAAPAPPTPVAADELVYAQKVVLDQPIAKNYWTAEQAPVEAGSLVVLKVDAAYAYPRQTAEPVLYGDDQTVIRFNHGYWPGEEHAFIVGFLPSALDDAGQHVVDLAKVRFFYGTPALPEQLTVAQRKAELQGAVDAGVTARPRAEVAKALQKSVGVLTQVDDARELHLAAAELVLGYSVSEHDKEHAENKLSTAAQE